MFPGVAARSIVSALVVLLVAVLAVATPPTASAAAWTAVNTVGGSGLSTSLETWEATPVDFDGDGRLTRWTYRNGMDLLRNDLTFDAASRITALADPISPARRERGQAQFPIPRVERM